jgi:energy-coupling factor transporter ATP-binding protein EcfA2
MVVKLTAKVGESDFVVVVGPFGCGKSSLVCAGLVLQLQEGALPGSRDWSLEIFVPGEDPLCSLAGALIRRLQPGLGLTQRLKEARELDQARRVAKEADARRQAENVSPRLTTVQGQGALD